MKIGKILLTLLAFLSIIGMAAVAAGVPAITNFSLPASAWTSQDFDISVTASDAKDMNSIKLSSNCTVDPAVGEMACLSNPCTRTWNSRSIDVPNVCYFKAIAKNSAGGTSINMKYITINNDNTPPTLAITLNPANPDGDNSWYKSDVTVTVGCSDAQSGIDASTQPQYRQDAAAYAHYVNPTTVSVNMQSTTFDATCTDKKGNVATDSKTFKLDKSAPTSVTVNDNPDADAWTNVTSQASVACTDAEGNCDSSTYKLYVSDTNDACPANYASYTDSDKTDITGHKYICGAAKDFAGNAAFTANAKEFKVDAVAPTSSNGNVDPASPATYGYDADYTFNMTWTDNEELEWVIFHIKGPGIDNELTWNKDGSGNQLLVKDGDVFSAVQGNLYVGDYAYSWRAKDGAGNWANTGDSDYSIVKKDTAVVIALDKDPVDYKEAFVVTCNLTGHDDTIDGTLDMYADSVSVASLEKLSYSYTDSGSSAAGTYNITCVYGGSDNYNGASAETTVTVSRIAPKISFNVTPDTSVSHDYGTMSNSICGIDDGDLSSWVYTYMDGVQKNSYQLSGTYSPVPSTSERLSAGSHNYTCDYPATQNYTGASDEKTLTLNQIALPVHLALNSTEIVSNVTPYEADLTVDYGAATTALAFIDTAEVYNDGFTYTLYRNGAQVDTGSLITDSGTKDAGTYAYVYNATGNENYTDTSVTRTLTVNKINSGITLTITPSAPVVYGTETTAACAKVTGDTTHTLTLYRNDVQVATGSDSISDVSTLAAGNYDYRCEYAESTNYFGKNVTGSLTINQASITTRLYIDGSESDKSIVYGSQTNATATTSALTLVLYRNGVSISNPDVETLTVGTYNYTAVNDGNENYTGSRAEWTLAISKASTSIMLYKDGAEWTADAVETYPYTDNINATANIAGFTFLRDGVADSNPDTEQLAAGTYNFTAYFDANENYTGASVTRMLTINQAANTAHLELNSQVNDIVLTYGDALNVTAGSTSGTFTITRNGTDVSGELNQDVVLAAGYYVYKVGDAGNENYSAASDVTFTVTVNKFVTTIALYKDGAEWTADAVETYPYVNNITTVTNIPGAAFIPDTEQLAAGIYNYTSYIDENENYTGSRVERMLTINPAMTTTHLYIDGIESGKAITYGPQSNATAVTSDLTLTLYRNGVAVVNPDVETLAVGTYNYTAVNDGNENYTGSSAEWMLTVNKFTTVITLYKDGTEWIADATATYPTTTDINATINVPGLQSSITLYKNGTSISNPESLGHTAGTYDYYADYAGNENYTAFTTATRELVIGKASTTTRLYIDGAEAGKSVAYGAQTNATATTSALTLVLYRNGVSTSNPDIEQLAAGTYNYTAVNDGNENYTGSRAEWTLTVSKHVTDIKLYKDGAEWTADSTATYPTAAGINATIDVPDLQGSITLYKNSIAASNPESMTQAAGTYDYYASYAGNENYTAFTTATRRMAIDKATTDTHLYIDNAESSKAITYGTQSNATATTSTLTLTLYRNGNIVSNPEVATLAAGTYNYTAVNDGNENYTGSSAMHTLTVNKVTTDIMLYKDGAEWASNSTATYPTAIDVNGTISVPGLQSLAVLYRNGIATNNPEATTLPAGTYEYYAKYNGNENYTAFTTQTMKATIDKASTAVKLYLNGTEGNRTYAINDVANFTATLDAPVTFYLRHDATEVSGTSPLAASRTLSLEKNYNITAWFPGNENYTASGTVTYFARVPDVTPPTITILSPLNQTYQVVNIWANATLDDDGNWVNVSVDGGAVHSLAYDGAKWSYFMTGLAHKQTHHAVFYAQDDAGNEANADRYFTIPCLTYIKNSTIDGTWYNETYANIWSGVSTIYCSSDSAENIIVNSVVTNSTVIDSNVTNKVISNMYIEESTVDPAVNLPTSENTTVKQNSKIYDTWMNNSLIQNQSNISMNDGYYLTTNEKLDYNEIIWTTITKSNICDSKIWYSDVLRSYVCDSYVWNSVIQDSIVKLSVVIDSIIHNSTMNSSYVEDSTVDDSVIINSTIINMTVIDANVTDGFLYNGTIIYDGNTYDTPTNITWLLMGPDTIPPIIGGIEFTNLNPSPGDNVTVNMYLWDNVAVKKATFNETDWSYAGYLAISGFVITNWTGTYQIPTGNNTTHVAYANATDYAGNMAWQAVYIYIDENGTVMIDANNPNVSAVTPVSGDPGVITVYADVNDDTRVDSCTLYMDGSAAGTMSGTPVQNGTVSYDYSFTSGTHQAFVGCTDRFGHYGDGPMTNILISIIPPCIGCNPDGGGSGGNSGNTGETSMRLIPLAIEITAPKEVKIIPGESASFQIIITSRTEIELTDVTMTMQGIPVSWVTLDTTVSHLKTNESFTTTVTVNVPKTEAIGAKTMHIKVVSKEGAESNGRILLLITNETSVGNSTVISPPENEQPTMTLGGYFSLLASNAPLTGLLVVLVIFGTSAVWYVRSKPGEAKKLKDAVEKAEKREKKYIK